MKKIIIFAALCLSFLTACDKEDLGGSNIHVPEFDYNALSETDKYIYDHYTVPYNVEVVYRWNQGPTTCGRIWYRPVNLRWNRFWR